MRLFMYTWIFYKTNSCNRTAGTINGVARKYAKKVFRETIHKMHLSSAIH